MTEEIDRLYTLPLEQFTPARDALARELRDRGDKDGAAAVKALRKPSRTAWALNQLARRHPDSLEELFRVTQVVRDTQRKVMSGAKADLRAASDERNAVVSRLVKLTSAVLDEAGHKVSAQASAAVRDSLFAVASDEAGAEALKAGRLVRELEPSSVVDVGGLTLVASDPEAPAPERPQRDLDALRRAVETAERRRRDAERAAELAQEEAERLQQAVEFARRAAEARRSDAAEAAAALREAEKALRESGDM